MSSVQLLTCVQLFATPWTTARQASLSITNSQSLLKLMSVELVMPSSHLILCHPLLLLPPIPPSIRVFSNESTLGYSIILNVGASLIQNERSISEVLTYKLKSLIIKMMVLQIPSLFNTFWWKSLPKGPGHFCVSVNRTQWTNLTASRRFVFEMPKAFVFALRVSVRLLEISSGCPSRGFSLNATPPPPNPTRYGLNFIPHNSYVAVLTSNTLESVSHSVVSDSVSPATREALKLWPYLGIGSS